MENQLSHPIQGLESCKFENCKLQWKISSPTPPQDRRTVNQRGNQLSNPTLGSQNYKLQCKINYPSPPQGWGTLNCNGKSLSTSWVAVHSWFSIAIYSSPSLGWGWRPVNYNGKSIFWCVVTSAITWNRTSIFCCLQLAKCCKLL